MAEVQRGSEKICEKHFLSALRAGQRQLGPPSPASGDGPSNAQPALEARYGSLRDRIVPGERGEPRMIEDVTARCNVAEGNPRQAGAPPPTEAPHKGSPWCVKKKRTDPRAGPQLLRASLGTFRPSGSREGRRVDYTSL